MTNEAQSDEQFYQKINPGHTDLIQRQFGDEYFSKPVTKGNHESGILDLNRIWETRNKLVLGVALDSLAQELQTDLTEIFTPIEMINRYSDRLTKDRILEKLDVINETVDRAKSTYLKAKEVLDAASFVFNNLKNIDIAEGSPQKPDESEENYQDKLAEWELRHGYIVLSSAIDSYNNVIGEYENQIKIIEDKIKTDL